jgi:23S rRNA (adenine2503-C2)-methyltransferase
MKCIETAGRAELAQVFLLELRGGPMWRVECVGAVDPALAVTHKAVIVVSSQFGCPVACTMCDAGSAWYGNLTAQEIRAEIMHVVEHWLPIAPSACQKLKVQFARMGEPALNDAVLDVIESLPQMLPSPGLVACVATTAPRARGDWFERLHGIRRRAYGPDAFQLQFSAQSTSESVRDRMIPIRKWSLGEIGAFARRFVAPGDRKVVLNFAVAEGVPVEPRALKEAVDPAFCVVKLTPLNPTEAAQRHGLQSAFTRAGDDAATRLARELEDEGFRCIVSVGDPEESAMGSSCGQLAALHHEPLTTSVPS